MSYLVLARKWRPQGFDDLTGQETLSRILGNAITQNRIAHAYVFSGPRGVGKTTSARILAKALNCEKGPTANPCGACMSCKGITDGSSIDVMEIDGASNNSVEDIRDIRERVKYAPAGGKYKVYIIDEAHMLSTAAFNALLKTLEEPPAHVVFVLATTATGKIPATVLSRCQHLPFKRIPSHKIKDRLKVITASEKISISDPALDLIARAADGSMRDSLTILDQVSAFSSDITDTEVIDLLGITDFKALSDLAIAVIKGEREKLLQIIAGLADTGTDFKAFSKDMVNFFRDLLVAKVVKKIDDILDISAAELTIIKDILKTVSEEHLTILLSEMIKAEADTRIAFSPRVAVEMALIKASFLNILNPVQKAIENIKAFGRNQGQQPRIAQNIPETPAPAKLSENTFGVRKDTQKLEPPQEIQYAEAEICGTEDKDDLKKILSEKIEENNHPLASRLAEADIKIEGDILFITFNGGHAIHAEAVQKNLHTIEKAASEIAQRKLSVKVETLKGESRQKKELNEDILSEPLVKTALELFEGKIMDIRQIKNSDKGGIYV